ncbi:MAG: glycine zipper 2TM domain-containing protein [Calditrichaeota bacterium]|nr:MAG: glycine zipper 2TM domain-containing protein [Calditrichota bacterium]
MKKVLVFVLMAVMLVSVIGCESMKKRDKGAVIGGTAGAVIGGAIGSKTGNTALGAIIGAAIGGAAGAYIGNYMDKQAAEMERDLEGAKIERVGEGIKITFDSGILFDIDKSALQPAAKTNLEKLAVILNKYQETEILIEGHTDATGSDDHNMDLSIRRAQSVSGYLATNEVNATRFNVVGYGETQPLADNETTTGRQQNRRVEIAIFANDKLKGVAEKNAEG